MHARKSQQAWPVICPYCKREAELVEGATLYPDRPHIDDVWFWLCRPCGAYTVAHKNSKRHTPNGTLANAELRDARQRAHAAFDPLWQSGAMTRAQATDWLAKELNHKRRPHIEYMSVEDCNRVVDAVVRFHVELLGGADNGREHEKS